MKVALAALCSLSLLACSAPQTAEETPPKDTENKTGYYGSYVSPGYKSWGHDTPPGKYAMPGDRAVELDYIIRGLADEMFKNQNSQTKNTPIAVTSLANMDDLQNTNWLGLAISEAFIHELHVRNMPVIDHKLTGKIKVTPDGDFVFSREWQDLKARIPVYRIFTGTMSRNSEGVIVNLRTINMQNYLVESTARAFVPNRLLTGGVNSLDTANKGIYIQRHSEPNGELGRKVELVK